MNPFDLTQALPPLLISFIATTLLAFVVGLELHSYRRAAGESLGFGTTRTLTLIATLGFGLFHLGGWPPYVAGLVVIGLWLGIVYWHRVAKGNEHLLTLMVALSTYLFGPLALNEPLWLLVLYTVVIILVLGQPEIRRFSDAFRSDEAVTLGKFLIMAGLVLPLLPDHQIASFISITWSQLWLAVVVVSGISYFSYLAQTYFFPDRSVLLTGVLGGLYSSTAVTVVLGRRAANNPKGARRIGAAIVLATLMMYLRLWLLTLVLGYHEIALKLVLPFAILVAVSAVVALLLYRETQPALSAPAEESLTHPLEFSTALLFATLFVVFAGVTRFVIDRYGAGGLHLLAFFAGFTDIDPFVLSALAGHFQVSGNAVEAAIVIASGSNNLLKAVYSLALSRNRELLPASLWLMLSFALSMIYSLLIQ